MLHICISLSVALVYAILIFVFAKGWDKTALFTAEPESVPDPWLSVVVALRCKIKASETLNLYW